jgi:hypothetical protein
MRVIAAIGFVLAGYLLAQSAPTTMPTAALVAGLPSDGQTITLTGYPDLTKEYRVFIETVNRTEGPLDIQVESIRGVAQSLQPEEHGWLEIVYAVRPSPKPTQTLAERCDFDGDKDVDLADAAVFQACFNGANRAPACKE